MHACGSRLDSIDRFNILGFLSGPAMRMFAPVARGIAEQRHEISTQVALFESRNST
jgi:hypothetical protein